MVSAWVSFVGAGLLSAFALVFILPHNKYVAWATVALLIFVAALNSVGR